MALGLRFPQPWGAYERLASQAGAAWPFFSDLGLCPTLAPLLTRHWRLETHSWSG